MVRLLANSAHAAVLRGLLPPSAREPLPRSPPAPAAPWQRDDGMGGTRAAMEPTGHGECLEWSWGASPSRRQVVGALALMGQPLLLPCRAAAGGLLPLDVYYESLVTARQELGAIGDALCAAAAAGTAPGFPDLKRRAGRGELGRLRSTAAGADQYVGERPLERWEEEAWQSLGRGVWDEGPAEGQVQVRTPLARPNAVVCNLFACVDDPRAPASTDLLLSFKMLEQGLSMGARGDGRVSADGLLSNVEDVAQKFDAYLEFVAGRGGAARR